MRGGGHIGHFRRGGAASKKPHRAATERVQKKRGYTKWTILCLTRGITCFVLLLFCLNSSTISSATSLFFFFFTISLHNMKIFNWVHRRFNSRAAENGRKNVELDDENYKGNVLECWRGGILTIGTFGYDSLKDQFSHDHDHVCDDDDGELAMDVRGHDYNDYDSEEEEEEDYEEEEDENPNLGFAGYEEEEEEEEEEERRREEFGFEYVMMEKKARTTLADLFHEDTAGELKIKDNNYSKCKDEMNKKNKKKKKQLLLDQLGPIHKLNKVMRRMLRRKIHPADIGAKIDCDIIINDHASLLIPTTQDVII